MSTKTISEKELTLLNELYFIRGIVFRTFLQKDYPSEKKDHKLKSLREINREIRMRNRLMKQQNQRIRTY